MWHPDTHNQTLSISDSHTQNKAHTETATEIYPEDWTTLPGEKFT